ncbi:MAG: transcriptional repressor [Candidatus Hodarchaeales archaeon]|jgi:Fe2+ or Zn2+ uptake regulation protein
MSDSKKIHDMITDEPTIVEVIPIAKSEIHKEFKMLLHEMKGKHVTAKDMYEIYVKLGTPKGLKTIYRYIEKLQKSGIIKESGQRMTEGTRVVETLYCRSSRVLFFEGPEVMDRWKTPQSQKFLEISKILLEKFLKHKMSDQEFEDLSIGFLSDQDAISDKILTLAQSDEEILDMLKELPDDKIINLIFTTTYLAIIKSQT